MKVFVNNVDAYLGNAVCTDIGTDKTKEIVGTLRGGFEGQLPTAVKKVVTRTSPVELLNQVYGIYSFLLRSFLGLDSSFGTFRSRANTFFRQHKSRKSATTASPRANDRTELRIPPKCKQPKMASVRRLMGPCGRRLLGFLRSAHIARSEKS
jgi:hypothetical protein